MSKNISVIKKELNLNKLLLISNNIKKCVNKKCKKKLDKFKKKNNKFNLLFLKLNNKYHNKISKLNSKLKKKIIIIINIFLNNNDVKNFIISKKKNLYIDSIIYNKFNIYLKKYKKSLKKAILYFVNNKIFKNYRNDINKLKSRILSSNEYKNLNNCNFNNCKKIHIYAAKKIKQFTKILCKNNKIYCNVYKYLSKINIDKLNLKQNKKLIEIIKSK